MKPDMSLIKGSEFCIRDTIFANGLMSVVESLNHKVVFLVNQILQATAHHLDLGMTFFRNMRYVADHPVDLDGPYVP